MRVLLLGTYSNFPVGLRYIASYLESLGHDVYLRLMSHHRPEGIVEAVGEIAPEVVGLTMYTKDAVHVLAVSQRIKQQYPSTVMVLGNVHATACHETILRDFPFIDYIILGEGELPFAELLEHLQGRRDRGLVHNLAYANADRHVVRTPVLSDVPDLDRFSSIPRRLMSKDIVLFNWPKIPYVFECGMDMLRGIAVLFTSRGCVHGCDYCPEKLMTRKQWRAHSASKVVDEIEWIQKTYDIHAFFIDDALFNANKKHMLGIFAEIERRRLSIRLSFLTGASLMDEEIVSSAKRAGCNLIRIGVDFCRAEEMHKHKRIRIDYEKLAHVIRFARSQKISVQITLILGMPGATARDMIAALRMVWKLRPSHLRIFSFSFIPGSTLFAEAVRDGYISQDYWLSSQRLYYQGFNCPGRTRVREHIQYRLAVLLISILHMVRCGSFRGILYQLSQAVCDAIQEVADAMRRCLPKKRTCNRLRVSSRTEKQ